MTAPDLSHLRRLAEAATPPGWTQAEDIGECGEILISWHGGNDVESPTAGYSSWRGLAVVHGSEIGLTRVDAEARANAALIVAMRNALPGLLDEIEAARAVVKRARFYAGNATALADLIAAYDRAIGAGGEG